MRKSRRTALLAAVFSTGLVFASGGAAQAESLAEAIALAYQTNPQLLSQRSVLRNVDESYYRTVRGLGPTVTADVALGATGTYDFDPSTTCISTGPTPICVIADKYQTSDQVSVSVSATQPLYSGGRLSANIRAQEAAVMAARENLRQVESAVLLRVVQAYVEVNRAAEALTIAEQNVVVLTRQREEAQVRFEVGASTRTDVAQAEARLATSQTSLIAARATLANAQAAYAQVVGQPPGKLEKEPSVASLLPADVTNAFRAAQENNPALRAAYLRERQSAEQVVAAKSAYRPSVTAQLTAGYDPNVFGQTEDTAITGAIRASVPLFTGLTTGSTVRSAIETNKNDNILIEDQRRSVLQQVTSNYNQLVSARASISSNEAAVAASNLAQTGTREEQQVGLRTTLDVLNAEQEYRAAQLNLVNARASEYIAAVSLLSTMGRLDVGVFAPSAARYNPSENFDKVNSFGLPWEPVVRTLDNLGAASTPTREAGQGEVVPTFEKP